MAGVCDFIPARWSLPHAAFRVAALCLRGWRHGAVPACERMAASPRPAGLQPAPVRDCTRAGLLSFRNTVSVTSPLLMTAPWIFAAHKPHAVVFGLAESRESPVLSLMSAVPSPSLIHLDQRWKQVVKLGGSKTHGLMIDAMRGNFELG